MKVIHVSTTDYGGAYIATKRINECLLEQNIDSSVLVRKQVNVDSNVIYIFGNHIQEYISVIKNFLNLFISGKEVIFDQFGTDISHHTLIKNADVICLHWVNSFISNKGVKKLLELNKPIVWVMHDMWACTGGCHHSDKCLQYKETCKSCPLTKKKDTTRYFQKRKSILWDKKNLYPLGPSRWIASCAENSKIFSKRVVYNIPNPINTSIFYPYKIHNTDQIYRKYNLNPNKVTVLFGAVKALDKMKGLQYFIDAMKQLPYLQYQVLIVGEMEKPFLFTKEIDIKYTGFIREDTNLCEIYNIADVLVASSIMENYSNTVLEALACATPAVVFNIGGMPELVRHKINGYVAKEKDVDDLCMGIGWTAEHKKILGENARKYVEENNSYRVIGKAYTDLFNTLCGGQLKK